MSASNAAVMPLIPVEAKRIEKLEIDVNLLKIDTERLAVLKDYKNLQVNGVDDKIGLKLIYSSRMEVRTERLAVQKTVDQYKKKIDAFKKKVVSVGEELVEELKDIETNLKTKEDLIEEEIERLKQEEENKKTIRLNSWIEKFQKAGATSDSISIFFQDEFGIRVYLAFKDIREVLEDEALDTYLAEIEQFNADKIERERIRKQKEKEEEEKRNAENLKLKSELEQLKEQLALMQSANEALKQKVQSVEPIQEVQPLPEPNAVPLSEMQENEVHELIDSFNNIPKRRSIDNINSMQTLRHYLDVIPNHTSFVFDDKEFKDFFQKEIIPTTKELANKIETFLKQIHGEL